MLVSLAHCGLHQLMFLINWNHEGIGSHVLITWWGTVLKLNYIMCVNLSLQQPCVCSYYRSRSVLVQLECK